MRRGWRFRGSRIGSLHSPSRDPRLFHRPLRGRGIDRSAVAQRHKDLEDCFSIRDSARHWSSIYKELQVSYRSTGNRRGLSGACQRGSGAESQHLGRMRRRNWSGLSAGLSLRLRSICVRSGSSGTRNSILRTSSAGPNPEHSAERVPQFVLDTVRSAARGRPSARAGGGGRKRIGRAVQPLGGRCKAGRSLRSRFWDVRSGERSP